MNRIVTAACSAAILAIAVLPASAQLSDGRLTGGGSKELATTETIDPTSLYNQAVEYIQKKDYVRAVPLLRDVLARREGDPATNFMMGVAQIGLNDLAEAKRYLSRAVSEKPDLAEAIGRLGWVEARQGNAGDAARHRGVLTGLKAKCAGTCPQSAAIDAAITVIDSAKSATSAATRFNQGIDALNAKKYAEADSAFGDVLAQKPDDWEAAYMRGQAQQALGNFGDAKISFEATLRLQPGVVDAKGRLGAIEKKLGNAQAAADLRASLVQSQQKCGGTCAGAKQIDAAIALIDSAQ